MRIGIIGAPESGKTKFAHELSELLEQNTIPFCVVDEYVNELRDETGLEYGSFGSHVDDLQVAFKRREWELNAILHMSNSITVGTILDSTAHCFVRAEDTAYNTRELMVTKERLHAVASTFGLLYTDTWDYDYSFYLPYKGDDLHSRTIDAALVEILRSYAPPIFSFKPEVKDDEKASIAAQTIAALEAEQSSSSDGSRMGQGSEDGEVDGDSLEPVPDVPEQRRASDDA